MIYTTGKGDDRFRRYEYWGIESYFMMHYVGNCTIFEGFCHRNSKDNTKPYIRSAPHVKDKVSGFFKRIMLTSQAHLFMAVTSYPENVNQMNKCDQI